MQELGRSGALADALATFADAHPGCERPAIASLWSAYFFASLIAPALAAGARLGRDLPLGSLHPAPATGLPATVHLAQEFAWPASLPAQVDRLLAETVAPVIGSLRAETGLSARLLWENAGGHLFWTLSEIRRENPDHAGEVTEALRALRWPREACSALTLMRADAVAGCEPPRRRVCCLRHGLPGSSHCEGICPLLRRAGESG